MTGHRWSFFVPQNSGENEVDRASVFQRRRRASLRGPGARLRHPGIALPWTRDAWSISSKSSIRRDIFGKTTGHQARTVLQRAAGTRLDFGLGSGAEGVAGAHSLEPQILDRTVAAPLAEDPAGSRGVVGARISIAPCIRRCKAARPNVPYVTILTDFADIAAAFLDRAESGAAFDLRDRQGGRRRPGPRATTSRAFTRPPA